ncbi:NAD(P)-dependent oxidoreductase [Alphaproteobacteria bacterium]|nr:NAD(P)-dependent oxidoreductase [Alphaproteobacteria bacterium]
MPESLLKFTQISQSYPEKRDAELRSKDFQEIYEEYLKPVAEEQSSRCSQCGVPFCQIHCPLQNNIPDWLMMTAQGRLEEAYNLASSTNNMPEICGRICPQDRLCEGNCVIEKGFNSVTIGSVEKYITDNAFKKGWVKKIIPKINLSQSVAIIGAGPGGLAAAEELKKLGYDVHVYDRYDRIGGLLIYGIPNFKLEKEIVERRANLLSDSGIKFHLNCEVGRDVSFEELRKKYDSLLIATGVYEARDIPLPGAGLKNIVPAMTYLVASNKIGLGDKVEEFSNGNLNAYNKNVVVLGGGDTAMDCVRTATRQGASSVKCLYRRDKENMPGSMREVQHAEEEGVEFIWLTAPEAYFGQKDVESIKASKVRLGAADATGRQEPEFIEDSSHLINCDLAIKAFGFDPEDLPNAFRMKDLSVTGWGTLAIDFKTKMTSIDGVFAAGDIVRGASLVVWAIRDGRDAAFQMHQYMQKNISKDNVSLKK